MKTSREFAVSDSSPFSNSWTSHSQQNSQSHLYPVSQPYSDLHPRTEQRCRGNYVWRFGQKKSCAVCRKCWNFDCEAEQMFSSDSNFDCGIGKRKKSKQNFRSWVGKNEKTFVWEVIYFYVFLSKIEYFIFLYFYFWICYFIIFLDLWKYLHLDFFGIIFLFLNLLLLWIVFWFFGNI